MDLNGANRKSFLSILFYHASMEKSAPKEDRSLANLYERIPQTQTVWEPIESLIQGLEAETFNGIENAVAALADAFEQQGFINGFRLGMMLQAELDVSRLDTRKEIQGNA